MKWDTPQRLAAAILLSWILPLPAVAQPVVPTDCSQLILGIADSWDSSKAQLTGYVRTEHGWEMDLFTWPSRLGSDGLAWGRGIHPEPLTGLKKREGDGRTPAGAFRIGDAYGYAQSTPKNPNLTYHVITTRDLWVEDASSPNYNRHLKLEAREPRTDWEKKQQMRQNDPAHRLKLFIAHNAYPDIKPGMGSAIFFHVWRKDGARPTSGCTVMPYDNLSQLIQWVDPKKNPIYVLLPRSVYRQVRESWGLP
jgi:L,D-peptidoglycan transpeptidase YkuD (ErfK/YbiS/YcfS/YnhG family)